jgi:hypothetical protein
MHGEELARCLADCYSNCPNLKTIEIRNYGKANPGSFTFTGDGANSKHSPVKRIWIGDVMVVLKQGVCQFPLH